MTDYQIHFEPVGRQGKCGANESILECAHRLGLGISSVCGGRGTCSTCQIRILNGVLSKPTSSEKEALSSVELKDGWRLACQTYPRSNVKVDVPDRSMTTAQRLQVEGLEVTVPLEPVVRAHHLKLPVPSLTDSKADADRLLAFLNKEYGLNCIKIDIGVLRTLSSRLRDWNWECQVVVRNDEVISIGPWPSRQFGLAIDLGTTKIAGYLVDLSSGETIASQGMINPQVIFGDDIISRITKVMKSPDDNAQLQKVTMEALNNLANDLCSMVGVSTTEIVDAVVVGNTAMHHLFLGLEVVQLALSPFISAVNYALDIKARDLSLYIAPGAFVHLLPNIAGFVGADHVAVLLTIAARQVEEPMIVLDIGTNTEVSIINRGEIASVSCASGPAFEGGHIRHGMRAVKGAIERIRIVGNEVHYQTIDNAPPIGICGSGILDAVAQLYQKGIINNSGRMQTNHPRVHTSKGQREFVLVEKKDKQPAITVTQQDIRELQLAKAAIRAGIQILLDTKGCVETEIKKIVIAGAFGTYIDVSSAIDIGMLPSLPLERFQQVGNAAGIGARLALVSANQRAESQTIALKIRYVELASAPDFLHTFAQASYLGRFRMANGKRKEIE
jgi:uncharacterized 2Fe-2S/4Fe-4S cluster protein (DUF4445 family)